MKTDDSAPQRLAPVAAMPTSDGHHLSMAMTSPPPSAQSQSQPRWNSKKLAWRLGADAASAACAGALIAPIITIIDRSIMENASGRNSLADSIRSSLRTLFLRPQALLLSRPCALVFALYGGTYMTANSLDTATSTITNRPASTVTSGPGKFAASSAANVGLCVYKDQVFVRMFGPPGAIPRPVPLPSYVLFTLRDCLTIFASFNLPPLLAPWIDTRLSDKMRRYVSGLTTAQFLAPASVQLFSTPVHLLSLDMYNRPSGSWRERWQVVRSNWLVSTAARMCRIIPAFGVGGIVNLKMRRHFMEKVE
ncbi:sequence orphan [Trichoderma arundinaceum]|uniref:Sequence orphan n=1 Tax=Trichoderma arundinaceum TaxID=490622 RepID=A0A395P1B4_TRIAR|nr:sequence orphan [Trichoderma arundinaceum]